MKKLTLAIVLLWIATSIYAQSTTVTLPTSDSNSNFNVNNSGSTSLLKVTGNGQAGIYQSSPRAQLEVGGYEGLLVTGTQNQGTARDLGAGARLHWYPKKGAFRVGRGETTYWDDANMGLYSIAMGFHPRATGTSSVAIGATNYSTGDYTVTLGYNCQATASYSIAIGTRSIASGGSSIALGTNANTNGKFGSMVVSDYPSETPVNASADNELTMRFIGGYRLFSSEVMITGVTLAASGNSWASVSDSTKKENFKKADGECFLHSLSNLKLGSWNYKTQNPAEYRHYGPMAQEIFQYFGKDELGVIGNDTTLASADMDGIMMICLQALEKRTAELKKAQEKVAELEKALSAQNMQIATQQTSIENMTKKFSEIETKLNSIVNNSELTYINSTPEIME